MPKYSRSKNGKLEYKISNVGINQCCPSNKSVNKIQSLQKARNPTITKINNEFLHAL